MTARLDPANVTVVAATGLEARAVRGALHAAGLLAVRVVRSGIGLSRTGGSGLGAIVVTCGLAGGIDPGLESGTVLIPAAIMRPDGEACACDPELVEALRRAARSLGQEPESGPLVTSATLVSGEMRAALARTGAVAVDMETGLIEAERLATVRVVLDTPARELSDAWLAPLRAATTPSAWAELPWLLLDAPRFARRAATILARALG